MDNNLLAKMRAVKYTRLDLGQPGNLVPIRKGDDVFPLWRDELSPVRN